MAKEGEEQIKVPSFTEKDALELLKRNGTFDKMRQHISNELQNSGAVQSLFAEATELIKGSNTWENAHRKDSHLARPALIGQLRGMLLKSMLNAHMTSEIDKVINAPAGLKETMGTKVEEVFTTLEEEARIKQEKATPAPTPTPTPPPTTTTSSTSIIQSLLPSSTPTSSTHLSSEPHPVIKKRIVKKISNPPPLSSSSVQQTTTSTPSTPTTPASTPNSPPIVASQAPPSQEVTPPTASISARSSSDKAVPQWLLPKKKPQWLTASATPSSTPSSQPNGQSNEPTSNSTANENGKHHDVVMRDVKQEGKETGAHPTAAPKKPPQQTQVQKPKETVQKPTAKPAPVVVKKVEVKAEKPPANTKEKETTNKPAPPLPKKEELHKKENLPHNTNSNPHPTNDLEHATHNKKRRNDIEMLLAQNGLESTDTNIRYKRRLVIDWVWKY